MFAAALTAFITLFVAEFGDKTQLAAMFLSAGLGHPLAVFGGAMLALFINHLVAIYIGSRFVSKLDPRLLRIGTAALFCLVGLAMLLWEALPSLFS